MLPCVPGVVVMLVAMHAWCSGGKGRRCDMHTRAFWCDTVAVQYVYWVALLQVEMSAAVTHQQREKNCATWYVQPTGQMHILKYI